MPKQVVISPYSTSRLTKNQKGEIQHARSEYNPSEAEKNRIAQIMRDYELGHGILNRGIRSSITGVSLKKKTQTKNHLTRMSLHGVTTPMKVGGRKRYDRLYGINLLVLRHT